MFFAHVRRQRHGAACLHSFLCTCYYFFNNGDGLQFTYMSHLSLPIPHVLLIPSLLTFAIKYIKISHESRGLLWWNRNILIGTSSKMTFTDLREEGALKPKLFMVCGYCNELHSTTFAGKCEPFHEENDIFKVFDRLAVQQSCRSSYVISSSRAENVWMSITYNLSSSSPLGI